MKKKSTQLAWLEKENKKDQLSLVVFCLKHEDFNKTKAQVNNFDNNTTQFKIDISGTEFIFLKDELLNSSEDKIS